MNLILSDATVNSVITNTLGIAPLMDAARMANKGAAYMRDALAQLGNAQRSEIESLDALIVGFLKAAGEKVSNIAAFNNRALAEDDARKRAAAEAERAQRIADLKSKLAAEGAE